MSGPVPVWVVTGPLGCGKTTILAQLMADKPPDERWVVLLNEFTDAGIDALTVAAAAQGAYDVRLVPGGCLCCAGEADFRRTLQELLAPEGNPPARILVEPSGIGHPAGIVEELLALGHSGAEYDAWLIRIQDGMQFGSGFVQVNPNSKIPALLDCSGEQPVRVFESGAILMYLAEKFGVFLPTEPAQRAECLSWLFWQMGSAPFVGGGFGHFYAYAPVKIEYAIDRYAMETKRQMDVLNQRLAQRRYVAGDNYTVADMAIWPWYGAMARGEMYEAGEFLQVHEYTHVQRWAQELFERPAVRRGRMVNRVRGALSEQLHERHEASDFDTSTQDKLKAAS